jgi:hypothetical protein
MRPGSPVQVAESWPQEHSARRVLVIVSSYPSDWRVETRPEEPFHTICCGCGRVSLPSVGSFRQNLIFSSGTGVARFRVRQARWGILTVCPCRKSSTPNPQASG